MGAAIGVSARTVMRHCRTLAPTPDLLLLDAPFSNLDMDAREHLAFDVSYIVRATGSGVRRITCGITGRTIL